MSQQAGHKDDEGTLKKGRRKIWGSREELQQVVAEEYVGGLDRAKPIGYRTAQS